VVGIEADIKQLAKAQRRDLLVGIAGSDRLSGPPSLDPTYTLPGARSIISLALPMDVPAIYDFLSKKSADPHNADQLHGNQEVFRIATRIADYLLRRGHGAKAAPVNMDYRRSPDLLSFHPAFSHRLGAIASGLGGQGWSGNVVTQEYGGAVYLGTVVTDAALRSDPKPGSLELYDDRCSQCKMCEKTCPVGMFEREREEWVLLNGELYPRGERVNIDLCTASCFGMHALSRDKKWTTWSPHWIRSWVDGVPDPRNKLAVRREFLRKAAAAGDSGRRTYLIQQSTRQPIGEDILDIVPRPRDDVDYQDRHANERKRIEAKFAKAIGIPELRNINVLTCGQCSLVCGPTLKERAKRYKLLLRGGYVVAGSDGRMLHAQSYDEAVRLRAAHKQRTGRAERWRDQKLTLRSFVGSYLGLEPASMAKGMIYEAKRRRAIRKRRATLPQRK